MKTFLRFAALATIVIVLGWRSFGQEPETPGIWKATSLSYPTIARLARIQGDVKLRLLVDKTGTITSVSKIDGPDALAVTAAKEVHEWRYASTKAPWQANLVIHYSLQGPPSRTAPVARVAIENPMSVSVTSSYPLPTGNPEVMSPK